MVRRISGDIGLKNEKRLIAQKGSFCKKNTQSIKILYIDVQEFKDDFRMGYWIIIKGYLVDRDKCIKYSLWMNGWIGMQIEQRIR